MTQPAVGNIASNVVHVVAAVIYDDSSNILIAKRPANAHQGGLWEFPGGKVELEELPAQALVRELEEELGILATEYSPLIQIRHDYPDKSVLLDVWKVTQFEGQPKGMEGQPIEWVAMSNLAERDFPAANLPIIQAAQLPTDYVITEDLLATDDATRFLEKLKANLDRGYRLIQIRTKSLTGEALAALVNKAVLMCQKSDAVLVLNSDLQVPDAASGSPRDESCVGLHLTGRRLLQLQMKPKGYRLVAASCHTEADIRHAEQLGVDFVTLSPVQKTQSHPDAENLGWERFQVMVRNARLPVYALGGLSRRDLERAIQSGAQGIASISAY
ncbi:MAG: hypothetical protein COA99_09670 [Moraxellaceae bacterium]|nr:MAG: hypothetical protein COA99_09670 [Moraxellaceae bacterium]